MSYPGSPIHQFDRLDFEDNPEPELDNERNETDAVCGNNPSSDASVTRRAFKIVHDERTPTGGKPTAGPWRIGRFDSKDYINT